ncbi:MAG: hypothetical protein ABEJ91_02245 [Candidatus Nanohaloarchaea archaeon]
MTMNSGIYGKVAEKELENLREDLSRRDVEMESRKIETGDV